MAQLPRKEDNEKILLGNSIQRIIRQNSTISFDKMSQLRQTLNGMYIILLLGIFYLWIWL